MKIYIKGKEDLTPLISIKETAAITNLRVLIGE